MRIKFFYCISLGSLICCMLIGCEKDWLGKKVDKQQAVPATIKDFQSILNNEGLFNREYSTVLAELASDGHHTTEAAWAASSDAGNLNAYTWSNNRLYDDFYWTTSYSRVFSSNVVLDALERLIPATTMEQKIWSDIKGQALYHRAEAFYRVAQIWSPVYNPSTSNVDLGVPLRKEADVTIPSVRSNTQQTYDQIISDLIECTKLLSSDFIAKTRPYKMSAFALLARVYLSMREYEKAGACADSCLKLNNLLMDFNELPLNSNFIGNANDNPEVIFHMFYITTNFLTTDCFIDSTLYNSYDVNDLRRNIFFKINTEGRISFKGNYNDHTFNLFCGIANDELFLIRAEGYARQGEILLAMKDLNDLLRTRWRKENGVTTYIDQTAIDAGDALRKILLERKKELLLRGLRWTDLRRLNFEQDFKEVVTRNIGGNTYVLEPGSFRYTFPIPHEIISRSTMPQNVGW